jgi:hypothetical protein
MKTSNRARRNSAQKGLNPQAQIPSEQSVMERIQSSNSTPNQRRLKPTLELQLYNAISERGAMTIEEIRQLTLSSKPIQSKSELSKLLKSLEVGGWIHKFANFDAYTITNTISIPSLKLQKTFEIETALKIIGKHHFEGELASNCDNVALFVLLIALQHPDTIDGWWNDTISYTEKEDFNQLYYLCKNVKAKAETFERQMGG